MSSRPRKTASQRPQKPVRSCSASLVSPSPRSTVPPGCHAQSWSLAPNSVGSAAPLTASAKRPGWCRGTQSLARTHTRYVPADGIAMVVVALATGTPLPRASR